MNLHEYQGKQLFAEYGLPVSKGYAVDNPHEAADRNYNYNDNSILSQAIQNGERGAYWDILRRAAICGS